MIVLGICFYEYSRYYGESIPLVVSLLIRYVPYMSLGAIRILGLKDQFEKTP